jgi:hypothetical protein
MQSRGFAGIVGHVEPTIDMEFRFCLACVAECFDLAVPVGTQGWLLNLIAMDCVAAGTELAIVAIEFLNYHCPRPMPAAPRFFAQPHCRARAEPRSYTAVPDLVLSLTEWASWRHLSDDRASTNHVVD